MRRSTLLKRVNAGTFDAVPAALMKWTGEDGRELPGLVRRRRAEAALWRALPKTADIRHTCTSPDVPQPPKPITRSKETIAAIIADSAGAPTVAGEAMPVIREGVGIMPVLSDALGRPAFLAALIVIMASVAIWVWRLQRLMEQGA
ncbi:MAG: hypothetical protein NTU78_16230 [Alphaproteobacteria bacterium]|nr:hypothetical protein [Alphaproteobacteria bacterium]